MRTVLGILFCSTSLISFNTFARSALFERGEERFVIQDEKGRTPTFRLFGSSPSEKAVALAIATAINAEDRGRGPRIPERDYIEARVEEFRFAPVPRAANRLKLRVKVSGHEFDVPGRIDRATFLAGQPIQVTFPRDQRDQGVLRVATEGELRFRLDPRTQNLKIESATGRARVRSALVGNADESLRFTGQGIRRR